MSRTKRPARRPTRAEQTPTIIQTLLDALNDGTSIEAACQLANIHPATFYNWMNRADNEITRLNNLHANQPPGTPPPTPHPKEAPFIELFDGVARVRARGERRMSKVLFRVAEGGYLISRRPALTGDGLPVYDSKGELVYEEVFAQPDWRAAAHWLERSRPRQWGRQAETHRIELGAEGAPGAGVGVADQAVLESLAERLRSNLARRAIEGGGGRVVDVGVTDAEIVEDDAAAS